MLKSTEQKIKQSLGLVESAFTLSFITILRFAKILIASGGVYALALAIPLELGKAATYWKKSLDPDFADPPRKKWLNRLFFTAKAAAIIAGISLALMGMLVTGFAVIIVSNYIACFRSLGKAIRSAKDGDAAKTRGNFTKFLVGGVITAGFTLLTFFPTMAMISWGLILLGTGFVILSNMINIVPELLLEKPENTGYEPLTLMEQPDEVRGSKQVSHYFNNVTKVESFLPSDQELLKNLDDAGAQKRRLINKINWEA